MRILVPFFSCDAPTLVCVGRPDWGDLYENVESCLNMYRFGNTAKINGTLRFGCHNSCLGERT